MPMDFTQAAGAVVSNAIADQDARRTPRTSARYGRVSGCGSEFKRSAAAGLIQAEGEVDQFRSANGARWSLGESEAFVKRPCKGRLFVPMAVGTVGSRTAGYQWQGRSGAFSFTIYAIIFRKGGYVVRLLGIGVMGTVFQKQVVTLATTTRRVPKYKEHP
jgi:hypothetical protein